MDPVKPFSLSFGQIKYFFSKIQNPMEFEFEYT